MPFDRRSFLKSLLALPIAATLDVEKLLWVPKPIITVPALPSIHYPVKQYLYLRATEAWNVGSFVQEDGRLARSRSGQRIIGVALNNIPAGNYGCVQIYGPRDVPVRMQRA